MKKQKIRKLILLYLLVLMLTIWLFFPIDLITYQDLVTKRLGVYFLINIVINTILIIIYGIGVKYFNSLFFKKKIILRVIIEIIYIIVVINLVLFIAQNIIAKRLDLIDFIRSNISHKSFFTTTLQGFFIMLLIETFYLYNKRKDSELEQEKFKYYQLKSQLNPHFLFNSLNILSAMSYTSTPKETSSYVSKLASVYRYILVNNEKDFISLKDEINFIYQYVDILQVRYSNSLVLKVDIEDEKQEKNVLIMTLQLLIENAVKHNIISQDKPLIIKIFSKDNFIYIINNKNKKDENINNIGIGLMNLNERYRIVVNKEIEVIDNKDCFTVKIPLI